ncbi:polysaccharide lyase family 14 protein [Backusella circina FSU 941]|nr:polysaccharide lyase family 14 protein [Backusella circina FSU 941]
MKTQALLIPVAAVCSLLSSVSASSWSFADWNSYSDASVGDGASWGDKWEIPSHDGWQWTWAGSGSKNVATKDPSGKSSDMVLKVEYPAGSRNPEASPNGGLGFRSAPAGSGTSGTLQYSVYFPKGFDFVKGGKLPGFYGGHGECTGGSDSSSCFSTRIMWREDGLGEVYAYLPQGKQDSNFCDSGDDVICNPDYGFSLGRGKFGFKLASWNTISQTLKLNTPGKADGSIHLKVNGKSVLSMDNIAFRTSKSDSIGGILFHTFFGGSDSSWATPKDQYSYFKGFSASIN